MTAFLFCALSGAQQGFAQDPINLEPKVTTDRLRDPDVQPRSSQTTLTPNQQLSGFGFPVRFYGNVGVLPQVLLEVVDLPKPYQPTQAWANESARRFQEFYRRTGYDLAQVRGERTGNRISFVISEGLLERIVIRGASGGVTAFMRLDLRRTQNVYNSKALDELLPKLAKKYGLDGIRYEIVRYEAPATILQLDDFIDGIDISDSHEVSKQFQGTFALMIYVEPVRDNWTDGFHYAFTYQSPYGVIAQTRVASPSLVLEDDRNILSGRLGLNIVHYLSLVEATEEWVAPPLISEWFRPSFRVGGAMERLGRPDLSVDLYHYFWTRGSVRLGFQFGQVVYVAAGVGYQIDDAGITKHSTPEPLPESARARPFYELSTSFNFEPDTLRLDLRHTLTLESRFFSDPAVIHNKLEYQKVFEYGYNTFHIYGRYADVRGQEGRWYDQAAISSRAFKSPATLQEFSEITPQASTEFHFSVLRDQFLVSAFAGVSGYVPNSESSVGGQDLSLQANVGPGIHSLLLDSFMLDLYLAFSFSDDGDRNSALIVDLRKVY